MQRRRQNRVRGTKRKLLSLRDEGCGGIVDENASGASRQIASIIASTAAPSRMSHLTAATLQRDLAHPCRRLQQFEPAAADTRSAPRRSGAPSPRRAPEPPPDQYPLSANRLFQTLFHPQFFAVMPGGAQRRSNPFLNLPGLDCFARSQ
jgi:hypothetical protein